MLSILKAFSKDKKSSGLIKLQLTKLSSIVFSFLFFSNDSDIACKDCFSIFVYSNPSFNSSTLVSILKVFPNDKKSSALISKH